MTQAQVALSCPECRAVLKGAPVSMPCTTGDPRDGLDAGLRGMRRGVSVPAVCRRCGTPYDVASAKIFVVYGERTVENDKDRRGGGQ